MTIEKFSGVYNFRRQEMVASFRFTQEGRFDFFYSYGAIDRIAQGSFTIEEETLKLISNKEPGKDFTVVKQTKQGDKFVIKINEANSYLSKYVASWYFAGKQDFRAECNSKNEIIIEDPGCSKIYLEHRLFPDIVTMIKDEQNTNNYFEVTLNPSLQQVSFKGIDFTITEDSIRCLNNYFMPVNDIVFYKENQ